MARARELEDGSPPLGDLRQRPAEWEPHSHAYILGLGLDGRDEAGRARRTFMLAGNVMAFGALRIASQSLAPLSDQRRRKLSSFN